MGITIGIRIGIGRGGGGAAVLNGAPSDLTATTYNATRIDLAFTINATDYDGHRIYYSIDGLSYDLLITLTGTNNTYQHTVTANTLYYYKVLAYKGGRISVFSNIANGNTSSLWTGLLAFWKFNESSGNALDSFGSYDLTNNGSATFVAGKLGNAGSLGTSNVAKSFTRNDTFGLAYTASRSIAGWIKIKSQPATNTLMVLWSFMYATNPGTYTVIYYEDTSGIKRLNWRGIYYNITLTTDKWYHFVQTHDHNGNVSKVYLNGEVVITADSFTGDYSTYTTRFSVGRWVDTLPQYASIDCDSVGFWNKILTQDEVTILHNIGAGLAYPFNYSDRMGLLKAYSAYCWFNSPRVEHSPAINKTFIGACNNDGTGYTQHVITFDHSTQEISNTKIGSVTQYDDHNEPSILIKNDNHLFAAFAEHDGTAIRWRNSTNVLDASAWEAESNADPNSGDTYTYANAFEVTNGDIYVFYRHSNLVPSAHSHWSFIKSTDGGSTFGAATVVIESTNSLYQRIAQDQSNKNIIHFITSYHPISGNASPTVEHYYFNVGTETFHKSDGTDITSDVPLTFGDMTTIWAVTDPEQLWIEDMIIDSNGYPRVLMTYYSDIDTAIIKKDLYYSEWNGSAWTSPYKLHQSINRNIGTDNTPTGPRSYPPLASFDRGNVNRIFAAKEVSDGGQTEIFLLTRLAYNSFTSVQKTTSFYDQWRPCSTGAADFNVFWLNKQRYTSYVNDYFQVLVCKTIS